VAPQSKQPKKTRRGDAGAPNALDDIQAEALALLANRLPIMLCAFDHKRRVAFWNDKCQEVLGYSAREIIGGKESFWLMFSGGDSPAEIPGQWFNPSGRPKERAYVMAAKDGSSRAIAWRLCRDLIPVVDWPVWAFGMDATALKGNQPARYDTQSNLKVINRISRAFLKAPGEEVFAEVLDLVLQEMDSGVGVFGYIDDKGDLVCPLMSRRISKACRMPGKEAIFPRHAWGGIWGESLKEKKTLYSNQKSDVPKGHISINRAISVPLRHRKKLLGIIMVANKPSDYTEGDVAQLEDIANFVTPVLLARLERDRHFSRRQKALESLAQCEQRQKALRANIPGMVYRILPHWQGEYYSGEYELTGYQGHEINQLRNGWLDVVHTEDRGMVANSTPGQAGKPGRRTQVYRITTKQGVVRWVEGHNTALYSLTGEFLGVDGIILDITESRKTREALAKRSRELSRATDDLRELNTALKVLEKKREEDKKDMQERVWHNINKIITPHLDRLSQTGLNQEQTAYLEVVRKRMKEITSELGRSFSKEYYNLSPREMEVANHVIEGKTSKEVAGILMLSPRSVEVHRQAIRKKLGISGKKINLRSHLQSIIS
jgi:PAS domain S-box-containing protein